jgi:hypothetical protein
MQSIIVDVRSRSSDCCYNNAGCSSYSTAGDVNTFRTRVSPRFTLGRPRNRHLPVTFGTGALSAPRGSTSRPGDVSPWELNRPLSSPRQRAIGGGQL